MEPQLDQIGPNIDHQKSKTSEIVKLAMSEFLLEDIWRVHNPDSKRYSWYRIKLKLSASRIDYALTSQGLVDKCANVMYFTGIFSDNSAMYLVLNSTKESKGQGYWKLNTSHLRNADFLEYMNKELDLFLNANAKGDVIQTWELLKYVICKKAKQYTREKASQTTLIIAQLTEKITEMENSLSDAQAQLLVDSKIDLEELIAHKTQGVIFISKAKYHEYGEKSTKYFLNLEST